MKCENCPYNNGCKKPNLNKPACLMYTKYTKAVAMAKVPKRYLDCAIENLPIEKDNPQAYRAIKKYCSDAYNFAVNKNMSLYLYSEPNKDNPMGTGTGKTTSACTILNSFIGEYVWKTAILRKAMTTIPALFVRCSDFQNIYNAQFRGQETASAEYYAFKNNMKTCALLVLDDIAIRSCTEAFLNELYEVINHRCVEELTTIYTSNIPRDKLGEILDQRIESRIRENCATIKFVGSDHRGF